MHSKHFFLELNLKWSSCHDYKPYNNRQEIFYDNSSLLETPATFFGHFALLCPPGYDIVFRFKPNVAGHHRIHSLCSYHFFISASNDFMSKIFNQWIHTNRNGKISKPGPDTEIHNRHLLSRGKMMKKKLEGGKNSLLKKTQGCRNSATNKSSQRGKTVCDQEWQAWENVTAIVGPSLARDDGWLLCVPRQVHPGGHCAPLLICGPTFGADI